MPEYKATVYSDGSVEWAISGGLKTFCAFTGLAKIPFDVSYNCIYKSKFKQRILDFRMQLRQLTTILSLFLSLFSVLCIYV